MEHIIIFIIFRDFPISLDSDGSFQVVSPQMMLWLTRATARAVPIAKLMTIQGGQLVLSLFEHCQL